MDLEMRPLDSTTLDSDTPAPPPKTYVFLIRCQGMGVIPDKVYMRPPTNEELAEHLAEELRRHGLTKDGKARERWVMVQEAEAIGAEREAFSEKQHTRKVIGILDDETVQKILAEKSGDAPAQTAVSAQEPMKIHGTGSVINPGEPGYVDPDRETVEIFPSDVGNLSDVVK